MTPSSRNRDTYVGWQIKNEALLETMLQSGFHLPNEARTSAQDIVIFQFEGDKLSERPRVPNYRLVSNLVTFATLKRFSWRRIWEAIVRTRFALLVV